VRALRAGAPVPEATRCPFSERQAASNEDIEALEKISGGREAPTLTVGSQVLRGFGSDSWGQYLDAAGYPRESRLPSSYQYRAATPISERRDATVARTGDAAPPAPQRCRARRRRRRRDRPAGSASR
jgi:hypothetical protein